MQELIIRIRYGGLGDHLLYSHLPRIAKQSSKYDKVFISNQSDYRYGDTKDFVWGKNPFVDGFTDENGRSTDFGSVEDGMNILDKIMLCFDLDDGVRYHEPEIHYQLQIINELRNAIIFDPGYYTTRGHPNIKQVETYFEQNNIGITHKMGPDIPIKDVRYFCNVIHSCKSLFCFTTGTATLAAALGKPVTVLYTNRVQSMFHHSKLHRYIELL